MAYLTEQEITLYTSMPGISMAEVNAASILIDAYEGESFSSKRYTEVVKLSKKRTPYGDVYRGKLKHLPRINVVDVASYVPTAFGDEQLVSYDPGQLRFDEDSLQYFTFIPKRSIGYSYDSTPYQLIVKYNAGYDVYPEELKRATGLLADNLKRNGGTMSWKSREDFDCKITLSDNAIFTAEIRQIVDLVRLS